jgi:hypothetical protein
VSNGQYPRLAGGKGGLFLLSGDDPGHGGAPTAVDVRRYDVASHAFGGPSRLATVHNSSGLNPDWGGLGENYSTGEVAAVWPDVGGDDGQLSLYISTDGGAHYSAGQDIGHVGSGYADNDNARVAVGQNGAGFVTWRDGGGLHVADLEPLASMYQRLKVHSLKVDLPVTCEAVKGSCSASATIHAKGETIGTGGRKVPSGRTKTLVVKLNSKGDSLLRSARHHRLSASVKLSITHKGSKTDRLTIKAVLIG